LVGSQVGPYQLIDRLGAGGMGEVFLGHDPRLQRRVALKCMTERGPDDHARVTREARAAARINHANIAAVYDIIEDDPNNRTFIVMEYVEGESLSARLARERVPLEQVRAIGRQLASALAAAHAQGVIHRDLKPANIHIAADGTIKVLDFGVAKLSAHPAGASGAITEHTVAGNPGTPIYMSPEQLFGQPIDHRSDIYSAGVILYQLATGRRPYDEMNAVALAVAMKTAAPPPANAVNPEVPRDLSDVIAKMLEQDPARRFESARDVEAVLAPTMMSTGGMSWQPPVVRVNRWRSPWTIGLITAAILLIVGFVGRPFLPHDAAPAASAVHGGAALGSIAVLPLQNLSADQGQEYIADGMTESIITELGRVRSLRVISRQSVMHFKNTDATIPQIAAQLGVSAVMTGSVTQEGDRLRVTIALMQPSPERQIWTETYERRAGDILALSGEVAQTTVRSVRAMVTPEEQAEFARARAMKPEAQQAYLLGRFFWNKRTKADNERAMREFQRAITLDPGAALAYAGLADCYIVAWDEGYLPPEEAYREAKANALRATNLDDTIAEAHASLGAVYSFSILWSQAEQEYRRALDLNPGYTTAHQWYSINLGALGRHEEAVAEARRALDLDPISPVQNLFLGRQLYFAGSFADAEQQLKKTIELAPALPMARAYLGRVYLEEGNLAAALQALDEGARLAGRSTGDLGYGYGVAGDRVAADRVLRNLLAESRRRYVHSIEMALVYLGVGDKESAVTWILKEYGEREGVVQDLAIDPRLKTVSGDPRFQSILRKSGLAYAPGHSAH
jgi:eukaryotic-like serine/threonine-protein kinase